MQFEHFNGLGGEFLYETFHCLRYAFAHCLQFEHFGELHNAILQCVTVHALAHVNEFAIEPLW